MSVVNIIGSRSGRRSVVHGHSREGVASGSTGPPKRPHTFPYDHDPPPSTIALSSRKKPRFDIITHGTRSNHVLDLEEENSQQEQLPDDFLEPLPPDESLAVDTPVTCMLPSFPVGLAGGVKIVGQVCRQFWKAGDYSEIRSDRRFVAGGMDHVRVHPRFLHSNATSHKWALGAVAELLDNAFDEFVNGATAASIDMVRNPRNGEPMLLIEDDGGGMDPDSMRHCMSLGYSVKSKIANTIGQYGNGFKTSTMRLGADVIVFSLCSRKGHGSPTESIGLLSYTLLRDTGQDDIIVPIVDYEMQPFGLRKLMRGSVGDWNKNMETITQWSPYSSEAQLLDQFKGMSRQGTRVVVYNLWEDDIGQLELDFTTCADDIQLRGVNRDENNIEMAEKYPNCRHYLTYRHSLRSYASILYLRLPSQFKIFLRGKEVLHHSLSEDLMLTEEVTYKPQRRIEHAQNDSGEMKAVVTVGFVKDAKEHIDVQGFSVYHKNRLIKPFWRIWNTPDSRGRGIIGVLEANFVEPAHDKQGFERTIVLARLETRLIEMQKSYWAKNCHKVGYFNKNLKKGGKLIPRLESPATDDRGIENCNNGLSSAQDLEFQGGAPSAALLPKSQVEFPSLTRLEWETQSIPASVEITALSAGLLTHSQVEFLSPTRPEWETQSIPVSMENTTSKVGSESHRVIQTLQDLATAQSLTNVQDIPNQSCGPQNASLEGGNAEKEAFSLKAMAVADSMPPDTDKISRQRRSRPTQTAVTEILDLDPTRTVQEKQVVAMESDIHRLPVTLSPRPDAFSTAGDLQQVNLVSGSSLRTGQNVDAAVQESSIVLRRTAASMAACERYSTEVGAVASLRTQPVPSKGFSSSSLRTGENVDAAVQESSIVLRKTTVPGRIPASMAACERYSTEVGAVASLRTQPVLSKGFSAPKTSIPEPNGDLSQNLMSEIDEIPVRHLSSAEKVVDVPSAFPDPIRISSSKTCCQMPAGSLTICQPLENTGEAFPQKGGVSAVRKNLEIQECAVNSCVNARQGSEMQIFLSLDKPGLPSSCECTASAELKSRCSCMEQEVQYLQRSVAEVMGEAEKLREQLQLERQLVETEMEELRNLLGKALSHLENLKTENNGMQSCITKA